MLHPLIVLVEPGFIDHGAGKMDIAQLDNLVPDFQLEKVEEHSVVDRWAFALLHQPEVEGDASP